MSTDTPLPPKREIALALIEGPSVFVHLDPRRPKVVVPKWFQNQSQLVLQIGMNMAVAIPDLEIGQDGISCTLSFNRAPHWCFLPWTAIYGLVCEDGRGMIWPDDVPSELAEERRKPSLKVVENKRERQAKPAAEKSEQPGEGTRPEGNKKVRLSAVPPPPDDETASSSSSVQPGRSTEAPVSLKAVEAPAGKDGAGKDEAGKDAAGEAAFAEEGRAEEVTAKDQPDGPEETASQPPNDDDIDPDGSRKSKRPSYLRVVK